MNITTIRIQKEVLKELRKHELHPRETNEDIIKRLIKLKVKGNDKM
jgi:predicted CopG family antitoxin|tara:strand:- start:68 stop:205 length:138 start_codon:yes stop_codon:yes gene_type:complete